MPTRVFWGLLCLLVVAVQAHGAAALQSGVIKGDEVNFRAEPGLGGRVISVLQQGLPVSVIEQNDRWYQVQLPDGQIGWISSRFIMLESQGSGSFTEHLNPAPVDEIISYAKGFLGTAYVYGGGSPKGFDCSGFTMYVFAKFEINLPHQADLQMEVGAVVPTKETLAPGDLVFFKTMGSTTVNHVGIYLGENQFIHASSGYGAVRISLLDRGYYYNCYTGGRRLGNNNGEAELDVVSEQ